MSWRGWPGFLPERDDVPDTIRPSDKELVEMPMSDFKKVMALAGVAAEQPAPTGAGTDVTALVMADLRARSYMGQQKYGDVLRTNNGRDALLDAYQEVLDLCCYLRQVIEERPK